jgi:hypothetical protein
MKKTNERTKTVMLWPDAHAALKPLCKRIAAEKGLPRVSQQDAVRIAILEALQKREQSEKAEA